MNSFVSGLFVICVLISSTNPSLSEENGSVIAPRTAEQRQSQDIGPELALSALATKPDDDDVGKQTQGRSLTSDDEEKKAKPLRNIFLGIYKNYKSTYLGNKTLTEYKQTLRESMKNKQQKLKENESIREVDEEHEEEADELSTIPADLGDEDDDEDEAVVTDQPDHFEDSIATTTFINEIPEKEEEATDSPTNNNNKRRRKHNPPSVNDDPAQQQLYNVGPALNMSLDLNNSIVKVNLDGESLKELVTGRWLSDTSEEGRGKKYEMVTRILPLFILPFLIQSAIVPFLVTKLKLLLMKSMLVGKLAIFLLIISAFRNSNKPMQTYEVAPSYWAGEPSRRSEMAAAASNMAYNGYRVEGKPTAWIN